MRLAPQSLSAGGNSVVKDSVRAAGDKHIDLLTNIFVLKALGWCFPGISEVGRSSLLLAKRSSFSFFLAPPDLFLLLIHIDFFMGITFFTDDTQIRTTEEQNYKRTVYLLDHTSH